MTFPMVIFSPFAGGGVTISFSDSSISTTNATTYSFTAQNTGTASSDRVLIVGAVGRATVTSGTVSAITIDGAAAATIVSVGADDTTNSRCANLRALSFSTGTTATIEVTFNRAMVRAGIGIWSMIGTNGATTVFGNNTATTANPTSAAVTIPANGGAVGICFSTDASGRVWTGLDEDFDDDLEGQSSSGAHKNVVTAESPATASVDTGAGAFPVMVVASWGPA